MGNSLPGVGKIAKNWREVLKPEEYAVLRKAAPNVLSPANTGIRKPRVCIRAEPVGPSFSALLRSLSRTAAGPLSSLHSPKIVCGIWKTPR